MIPFDYITEWRAEVPWVMEAQVEQDLILSRAVVSMFAESEVANLLAFRGGTAIYKLHLRPAVRYSEDIDLVQVSPGPIGGVLDVIRCALDPWLGAPRRSTNEGRVTLIYRMNSEAQPPVPMRLKVEINSREHFSVFGIEERELSVRSRWFTGNATVKTYQLDELLGTKLRALYQRKKGRDLFDLFIPIRSSVDAKCQAAQRPFDLRLVVRETGFMPAGLPDGAGIQDIYASLAADQDRNDLIFDDVVHALEEKR